MKKPIVLDIAYDLSSEVEKFREIFSDRKVINLQDEPGADLNGVSYALVWKPSEQLFDHAKNLEVIFSVGAGVDHILVRDNLPNLPIVRFVDPSLTNRMSEWICLQCLMHLRAQKTYYRRQDARKWEQTLHPQASDLRVGIMGLGTLGQDAAKKLLAIGFKVIGWSRNKKEIAGVSSFGADQLDLFLSQCDLLVGLLPSTHETQGIFNRSLFSKLPSKTPIGGPVFINAGRGMSQIEADIIECLDDGTLGGVSLDVFQTEPLPIESPLWTHDKVYLTPHTAAESDAVSLAKYVEGQIERHERGEDLLNVVDRSSGY